MRRKVVLIVCTIVFIIVGIQIILHIIHSHRYDFPLDNLIEGMALSDNGLILNGEATSRRFSLREGEYEIRIEYEADNVRTMLLSIDNDYRETFYLPTDSSSETLDFAMDFPTDRAYLGFEGDGTLIIKSIIIVGKEAVFTDYYFKLVILILLYLLFIRFFFKYGQYNSTERFVIIAVVLLIFCVNIPFYIDAGIENVQINEALNIFNPATRLGIDTRAHLLRFEGVFFGLKDGQLPVIISPNYLVENGELSFLYPDIFLYPFALMRFFGASLSFSYRLLGICINVFTCLVMLYSCRQISDNDYINVFITGLYLFEPHRLMVMFDQGAIAGMALPYIFVPLCIVGIYQILRKRTCGALYTALGVFGVLQSHILSMILVLLLFLFLFAAFIKDVLDRERAIIIVKTILISLVMNAGFLIFFLYYWHKGVNTGDLEWIYTDYVLTPVELLKGYQPRFLIIMLLIASGLWFVTRKHSDKYEHKLAATLIMFSALLLLLASDIVPWELLFRYFNFAEVFFKYLQDPNRFYTILAGSLLLANLLLFRNINLSKRLNSLGCLLTVCLLVIPGVVFEYSEYLSSQPLLFDEVLGDVNSKDQHDYLPKGVDPDGRFSGVASLSDESKVESYYYNKKGTHVEYTYLTDQEGVFTEFPLLLYSGYIGVDDKGESIELLQGTQGRIRTFLNSDGEMHAILIQFRVKMIFKVFWIISLIFSMYIGFLTVRQLRMQTPEL